MSKDRRRRTARLRAEAAAIERRLERAVVPDFGGPVVITGRRVRWRILAYNQWQGAFFRLVGTL